MSEMERRPLKSRDTNWARALAAFLARIGITPNQISILSIIFAALSLFFFCKAYSAATYDQQILFLVLAPVCIQMRLLCNLFDGMVAVEHNKKSALGDMYNDVPDRIADLLIILGAGYAVRGLPFATEMAWLGGSLAITTAYIRVLGKSLGTDSYFLGPMAKPHRMFLITVCSLFEIASLKLHWGFSPLYYSLMILNIGCFITCWRRLVVVAREKTRLVKNG